MRRFICFLACSILAIPAGAEEFTTKTRAFFEGNILLWATASVLVEAMRRQNSITSAHSQE